MGSLNQKNKNIAKDTAHIIVSRLNHKQWPMFHIFDLIMKIKWNTDVLMIIETEISMLKAHSLIYCINDWENGVITLDRIYLTSIYKFNNFQMSFHNDDDVMWKQTNTTSITKCHGTTTWDTQPRKPMTTMEKDGTSGLIMTMRWVINVSFRSFKLKGVSCT